MKSYTDFKQSKKLAEILPLESADMVLLHEEPYETSDSKFDGLHQALCVPFSKYDKSWRQKYKNISYFPCWSLAALLDILDYPQLSKDKLGSGKTGWMVSVYHDNCRYDSCWHNNSIDACYEMIIKLKDLNLL